jgi:hypothetical protein
MDCITLHWGKTSLAPQDIKGEQYADAIFSDYNYNLSA